MNTGNSGRHQTHIGEEMVAPFAVIERESRQNSLFPRRVLFMETGMIIPSAYIRTLALSSVSFVPSMGSSGREPIIISKVLAAPFVVIVSPRLESHSLRKLDQFTEINMITPRLCILMRTLR